MVYDCKIFSFDVAPVIGCLASVHAIGIGAHRGVDICVCCGNTLKFVYYTQYGPMGKCCMLKYGAGGTNGYGKSNMGLTDSEWERFAASAWHVYKSGPGIPLDAQGIVEWYDTLNLSKAIAARIMRTDFWANRYKMSHKS
jgi:hypothetical protein